MEFDEDGELEVRLRLSAQKALWQLVPPTLRAVSVDSVGSEIVFRAVFEPGAPEADRDLLEMAATEVIAQFSSPATLREEHLEVPPPTKPPHLRYVVFERAEKTSENYFE
jgi:hypothetical protein